MKNKKFQCPGRRKGISGKALRSLVAGVCVLTVFLTGCKSDKNAYTAPLDLGMDRMNARSQSGKQQAIAKQTNGFLDEDMAAIYKYYEENGFDEEYYYENNIAPNIDQYGENYTFYYEIDSEEELEEDALEQGKLRLKNIAANLKEYIEELENPTDYYDPESEITILGPSVPDDVLESYKSIYKKLKGAKITAGYVLEYTIYVKGNKLDKPEEYEEDTVCVYEIDGRWVALETILNGSFED